MVLPSRQGTARSGRRPASQGAHGRRTASVDERYGAPSLAGAVRGAQELVLPAHHDNLVALGDKRPELRPLPSYSTLRRFLKAHGIEKQRRLTSRRTEGAERAEARLFDREVRSYEAEYVGGVVHWDCHVGPKKVLTPPSQCQHPILFGVIDDRSPIACRLESVFEADGETAT